MIFENIGDNLLVVVLESLVKLGVWDFVEGIVAWRENLSQSHISLRSSGRRRDSHKL